MQDAGQQTERSCGSCTLCCRLPEIDALSKPADTWCMHCTGQSCAIYADRPQLCRDFLCLWMTNPALADTWRPLTSHMLIYAQGPQMTVLVDPDHPDVWRHEPWFSGLQQIAKDVELEGGYLILFCGDEVVRIEPPKFSVPA
ncbi:hypothetical protein [Rhizobium populisoli]|uniref:hypothetical protein n=1 Tax=Rhizobium populisoli TaxID=2859785 RepID=UPI0028AE9563|nr:hypothetical protein [Rhizobium populisoli]